MKATKYFLPILLLPVLACHNQDDGADAYGNFEAVEVMVSAEIQGRILEFVPEEGSLLEEGQVTARIDSTQLYLKKIQLESGFSSLGSRIRTLDAQVRQGSSLELILKVAKYF